MTTPSTAAFLLLDRSGSMASLWDEALGAINGYVEKVAKDLPDMPVTVAIFDSIDKYDVIRKAVPASAWTPITSKDASPRGSTPLYDAVVSLLADANAMAAEKTTIVIMTDGHENASREATKNTAKAALDAAQARNWDVLFLGANWDAMDQAAGLGVDRGKTLNVSAGRMGAMGQSMATRNTQYASGNLQSSAAWSAEDRERTK